MKTKDHSASGFDRAAAWHFPPFLWRALPTGAKDKLRDLRQRMLAAWLCRRLPRNLEFRQTEADAEASAPLSIVVPVHDSPEVTERCLLSLQDYAPHAEVILVDDGSKLEATRALLDTFAARNKWKLVQHTAPSGHSAACNAGASLAKRSYVCLLNSDTVVTPWCWRLIVESFEKHSEIGVAGPSTSCAGTVQCLPLVNLARHDLNNSQIYAFAARMRSESSHAQLYDLPKINGFAFFIRRNLWQTLGGFDLNIPDYGNEDELCARVRNSGWRTVWVRNAYIHHFGSTSYRKVLGTNGILGQVRSAKEYIARKHANII